MHRQLSAHETSPTHADVTNFLELFLPPSLNPATQAREVPYLYHTVRNPHYSPTTQLTSRIVFSITPTSSVYSALHASSPRHKTPVCFLHRPFNLDRRNVRRGSLVLACHKSFDEHLTVGWNEALAMRLGLNVEAAVCIRGYKGDDERKIGLVAQLSQPSKLVDLVERMRTEFATVGEIFETKDSNTDVVKSADTKAQIAAATSPVESGETLIKVIAIMNAFHAEEVERVLAAAKTAEWIDDVSEARQVLYLTGAARQPGLEALAKVKMPAFCVGHVSCEEWGIRYLAQQTRDRWPELEVIEVFEEEEPRPSRKLGNSEGHEAEATISSTVQRAS